MGTPSDDMYMELSKLLQDVSKFLTDDRKLSSLSPKDRALADSLINRCKVQLTELSKVTEYVDMDSKKVIPPSGQNLYKLTGEISQKPFKKLPTREISMADQTQKLYKKLPSDQESINEEDEQIYNDIDENIKNNSCPYIAVAVKDINRMSKCGCLSWRVKVLLNIWKMKTIYALIHENWMLIYNNEKGTKPKHCIDLHFHEARELLPMQNSKTVQFEIFATGSENKYTFASLAYKDMIQWVTTINRIHDSIIYKTKILPIEDGNGSISKDEDKDDDDDNVYADVEILPLPPPTQNIPIHNDSEDTEEDIYDVPIIGIPPPTQLPSSDSLNDDSFSENENEDDVYDVLVDNNTTSGVTGLQPNTSIRNPPRITLPPQLPVKLKLPDKPQFARLQSRKLLN